MSTPHAQPNPMDPMLSFWKEAWARMAVAAPAGGVPGTPGTAVPGAGLPNTGGFPGAGADPLGWMPTPEMLRRMQSAFLDTMASASEQYMRSPQFVDQMKQSFDAALDMRRQMEEMIRRGATGLGGGLVAGDPLATPGQAAAELLAGLRAMESRLTARLDDLAMRIASLESSAVREPSRSAAAAASSAPHSTQDDSARTAPKGGARATGGSSTPKG